MSVKQRIMTAIQAGDLAGARAQCEQACETEPNDPELLFILSGICGQQEDFASAENYCMKVLDIHDSNPSTYYNLAVAQRRLGKLDSALDSHQRALSLNPEFMPSYFETGNICLEIGDHRRAIENYQVLLEKQPGTVQVMMALARAQALAGDHTSAVANYEDVLRSGFDRVASLELGKIYEDICQFDSAIRCYERILTESGNDREASLRLARLCVRREEFEQASRIYGRLLQSSGDDVEILCDIADMHMSCHQYADALHHASEANRISPDDIVSQYTYAKALASSGDFARSAEVYNRLIQSEHSLVEPHINLGNIYLLSGDIRAGCEQYRKAMEINPDDHRAYSNYLMSINYDAKLSDEDRIDIHRRWGSEKKPALDGRRSDFSSGRIKIGYVSPDLRKHSVAYFLDAIIRNHGDRFEVYCYCNNRRQDMITDAFRDLADGWCDIYDLDDAAAVSKIREDEIDVLIDLTGHMADNRLGIFMAKAAPIQVTYLGYPNTTGLDQMDYRIVDRYTDPVDSSVPIPEERLYIDPGFLCYTPLDSFPPVSDLPAASNQYITFGSFNNLAKMSDDTIALWSRVLKQVPGSRLCVKARPFSSQSIIDKWAQRFSDHGITRDRLDLLEFSRTVEEHLACYSRIDIALDTTPYSGTTTTAEALWMGVPVITLAGDCHAGRVGVSMLTNTGMPGLIAEDSDHFVEIARELSNDVEGLVMKRAKLRDQVAGSDLCDAENFVKSYEEAILGILEGVGESG